MSEKVDAPIQFKGVIFLKTPDGQRGETEVSFGYGNIPNKEKIIDMVHDALDMANEQTGRTDWSVVNPQELMETAGFKEFGHKVCCPMGDTEYEIYK